MAKQIYIDENGNEQLVSGTINTADMLPIQSGIATNTKDYIDTGLSGTDISSSITLNSTNFELTTWGGYTAYAFGGKIVLTFWGVKTKSAITNSFTTVFTIPQKAKSQCRNIVYENHYSNFSQKDYSMLRISSGAYDLEVYNCPNEYALLGQIIIKV